MAKNFIRLFSTVFLFVMIITASLTARNVHVESARIKSICFNKIGTIMYN
ncbi:hypothetical protein MKX03_008857 [Papaver bracteatum]|nr:hypothetical protein MKX03_008857 [Papaver bracteatum]